MPEHDLTPSGSNPSASAPLADVPRMPDPRVREFTAHSIDSGLALLFELERGIVELDPERKAAMVSNLLVALCGDRAPRPVLNTGSLYQ